VNHFRAADSAQPSSFSAAELEIHNFYLRSEYKPVNTAALEETELLLELSSCFKHSEISSWISYVQALIYFKVFCTALGA